VLLKRLYDPQQGFRRRDPGILQTRRLQRPATFYHVHGKRGRYQGQAYKSEPEHQPGAHCSAVIDLSQPHWSG
jgi:hypothetical protein